MTHFLFSRCCGVIGPTRAIDVALVSNITYRMADGIGGEDEEQAASAGGISLRFPSRVMPGTQSEQDFEKE